MQIVIIEDDPKIVELYQIWFEDTDHDVKYCQNGIVGAKILVQEEFIPEVLVCDLAMPVKSGQDVIKLFRSIELGPKIPIIVVSAHINEDTMDDLSVYKPITFLQKPVDREDFFKELDKKFK